MMIGIGIPTSQSRMPRIGALLHVVSGPERAGPGAAPGRSIAHPLVSPPVRGRAASVVLAFVAALCAACATDPSADYLDGIGDPVRGAALYAPRNLGDTGRWTRADGPAGLRRRRWRPRSLNSWPISCGRTRATRR